MAVSEGVRFRSFYCKADASLSYSFTGSPPTGPGAVLSDWADHLPTSLKPMLTKLRRVSGVA